MERCPTCRAEYRGREHCHRCKTDLRPLLEIERRAEDHRKEAINALEERDFDAMFFHARRARRLHGTAESERLLACAAVLSRNFSLAVSLWNR